MLPKLICACSALLTVSASGHPGHTHSPQPGRDSSQSVVVGNGSHLYQTVPGWGSLPGGEALGPTHGGVAVDSENRVYVSTDGPHGICVFAPDGSFVESIATDSPGIHSLTLREEDGREYLYGAHLNGQRVVKFSTDGTLELEIEDSEQQRIPGGLKGLTAVAVAPDGRIFASVGYGSNYIHIFSPEGKLLKTFGGSGDAEDQFNTCHGLALDRRYDPARLIVADRENRQLKHFDLDGNFIAAHSDDLRRPCAMAFFGDFCAVAELEGRVTIVDRSGVSVAFLGDNPDPTQWANYKAPLEEIPAGIFTAPHGIASDSAGNLYVQDWNASGRLTKLERLDPR